MGPLLRYVTEYGTGCRRRGGGGDLFQEVQHPETDGMEVWSRS